MSDKDALNMRKLPPVEPIAFPDRYSQTLLRNANDCRRSGYLYARHSGGAPATPLDRGSAGHAVFEHMTLMLLESGERKLWAPGFEQDADGNLVGEDPVSAQKAVASFTAEIVDEVLKGRPDLPLPVGERDAVRIMAYHWAVAMEIDPEKVVGVEQKFVLDVGGREVSGIVDLAQIAEGVAEVVDYKTSLAVPDQGKYEKGFQAPLYAALLLFGQPVERIGGVERRLDPIGERVQWVRTRELYPRFLRDDGGLSGREQVLSRTEVRDFLVDVEALVVELDERRVSWDFPARPGSHCGICPARSECPLPAHLRSFAGEINTMPEAAEAAAKADTMRFALDALEKEIKIFAGAHGPVRYGKDLVRRFEMSETRSVRRTKGRADWEGLEVAAVAAAELGEPFSIGDWVKHGQSQGFKRKVLSAEELAAEDDVEVVAPRDFGDAPPF